MFTWLPIMNVIHTKCTVFINHWLSLTNQALRVMYRVLKLYIFLSYLYICICIANSHGVQDSTCISVSVLTIDLDAVVMLKAIID